METIYNVDYFLKKFEAIPEDKWTTGIQQNKFGQRCALGHCRPLHDSKIGNEHLTLEAKALKNLFIDSINGPELAVVMINNGNNKQYQQPTPKQRILAALYDIKNLTRKDATAELIETPVVEEKLDVVGETKSLPINSII